MARLTQGNLTIHLSKLEDAGYVTATKEVVRRKPRTTLAITDAGRDAFLTHLEKSKSIAGES